MDFLQKISFLTFIASLFASFSAMSMENARPSAFTQRDAIIFGTGIGIGALCVGGCWAYHSMNNAKQKNNAIQQHIDKLEARVIDNEKQLVGTAQTVAKHHAILQKSKYHSFSDSSSSSE